MSGKAAKSPGMDPREAAHPSPVRCSMDRSCGLSAIKVPFSTSINKEQVLWATTALLTLLPQPLTVDV